MPQDLRFSDPKDVRLACRRDELEVFPSLTINGYLCVNIVMMDAAYADDFHTFCKVNAVSCPLIARVPIGQRQCPEEWAADCDLCTDLRSYDVSEHGEVTGSRTQVADLFSEDPVTFLIGSSVSFDGELEERGWTPGWGPCIYDTTVACETVGPFAGHMAVTMRSFPSAPHRARRALVRGPSCHEKSMIPAAKRVGESPALRRVHHRPDGRSRFPISTIFSSGQRSSGL